MGAGETVGTGHPNWVHSVAFSPDRTCHVVSGSRDRSVCIWDAMTGEIERTLECHSNWVIFVVFLPNRICVVSGSTDYSVRIWNVGSGEMVRRLYDHMSEVLSITFLHDGTRIVQRK